MMFKEDDDYYTRRHRVGSYGHVRIELPPPFSGDDKQSFTCWARQFEVAVKALTEGDGTAVERLSEDMRQMRMELKYVGEENLKLQSRLAFGSMEECSGAYSQSSRTCRCNCGGRGCHSRGSYDSQRGRSPDKRVLRHSEEPDTQYHVRRDKSPFRYPVRRSPSPNPQSFGGHMHDYKKRGVRFISPSMEDRQSQPGN
ncbi:hypothetical protein HF521_018087 [Silurus meridionalis]|uniref:Uncharacterized protein n=1 Tax=Silurus meridionalis TaxID=175797 RepID=A0A8T0BUM8_SILME|nr:hypothetical protein HF521_018087 [Silurus meridionalis]